MSILFLMPTWQAPSETWMQRMLEELDDELGVVVAWETGGETMWRNHVRAVALNPRSSLSQYYNRFFHKIAPKMITFEQKVLLREIYRPEITQVLCQYGAMATEFMPVWRMTKIPLFIHFHGFDATFDRRQYNRLGKLYFPNTYLPDIKELAKRAIFIANSEFTKSLLINIGIPASIIHVKYLGVPIPPEGKIHNEVAQVNILQLGRLVDFKSPDRTIRAFEIARSRGMLGKLTIAGDGPLMGVCQLLKTKSPFCDSIELLGAVSAEDAQGLLFQADIFTQHNIKGEISRQSESLGVSILEAMAMGLPIVGTRNGGVPEIVVDKENGILTTPGNIQEQADALLSLVKDSALRQKYGDAGRKRVSELFTMEKEGRRLREIMQLPTTSPR
jgi:colanic acid/amylovoran biosynthesis glycosyltransferase